VKKPRVVRVDPAIIRVLRAATHARGYPIQEKIERAQAAAFAGEIAKGLPEMEREYLRTRNPYYALEAWEMRRLKGVPIPPWVETWTDDVCHALLEVDSRDIRQIAKAVGFGTGRGARSAARQYAQHRTDQAIAQQVRAEMNKLGGDKQHAAIHAVAQRHGKSFSAIDAAVRRAKRPLPSPRRR
jgi:hypothetical protein